MNNMKIIQKHIKIILTHEAVNVLYLMRWKHINKMNKNTKGR